ncbi:LysR family transcriptional regulator [Steroidobacter sp. S1-65]|uniref:LysR family transcriptional regulator n=1 Tax=Steroidobacter gossypii TaxID=2805490 RepID=A0ABS1X268_9GAMM|nr:LysR family transcriptional regulator [Steroidobacter gossypii]MBM0107334.1 LysR family transcriptional regulator [Steroidobacter gossypii]
MDNRTGEIEAFLRTVEGGSFAAAAKTLRQTPSAVSRSVARLEARLGVRLLTRTTRSLSVTPEGDRFRAQAQKLLLDLDELERSFAADKSEPRGRLRVSASTPFGIHQLLPALPEFLQRYPKITVDLSLSDALVDLVGERTDVAIRHGPLRDSSLRARKLGSSRWIVAAAPDYLQRHGTPQTPADLEQHNCLNFNYRRSVEGWTFLAGARSRQYHVAGNFMGNSGEALRLMCLGGAGIARLGDFLIGADVRAGRLVPLLQNYLKADSEDVHALYIGHARLAARVRVFMDFLVERVSLPD